MRQVGVGFFSTLKERKKDNPFLTLGSFDRPDFVDGRSTSSGFDDAVAFKSRRGRREDGAGRCRGEVFWGDGGWDENRKSATEESICGRFSENSQTIFCRLTAIVPGASGERRVMRET